MMDKEPTSSRNTVSIEHPRTSHLPIPIEKRSPDFRTHLQFLSVVLPDFLFIPGSAKENYENVKAIINEQVEEIFNQDLLPSNVSNTFYISLKEAKGYFTGEVFMFVEDVRLGFLLRGLNIEGKMNYVEERKIRKKSWASNGETDEYIEKFPAPTFVAKVIDESYQGYKGPLNSDGNIETIIEFKLLIIDRNKYEDKKGKRHYQEADSIVTSVLPKGTPLDDILFLIKDFTEDKEVDGKIYPYAEYIDSKPSDIETAIPKGIILKTDFDPTVDSITIKMGYLCSTYKKARIVFTPNSSEGAFVKQLLHRSEIDGNGSQCNKIFEVFFSRESIYVEKLQRMPPPRFERKR